MRLLIAAVFGLAVTLSNQVSAWEIFESVDANGVTVLTDIPPDNLILRPGDTRTPGSAPSRASPVTFGPTEQTRALSAGPDRYPVDDLPLDVSAAAPGRMVVEGSQEDVPTDR